MPASLTTTIHVLWGRNDRYTEPQFVGAWPDGLVDSWHEWYIELRKEALERWLDFSDESDPPWTFWMTVERLTQPTQIYERIDPASGDLVDA